MKRFIIQFKELYNNEALHSVEILNTGSASGTVYLTGAKTPFEWEEDDSDNLLEFPRRKTGTIAIVVTPDTGIDGLLPTSPTSHRVEVDGKWVGYLEPNAFNIPMYEDTYVLKLNVQSFIGTMDAQYPTVFYPNTFISMEELLESVVMGDYFIMPAYAYDEFRFSALLVNPYRTDKDFKISQASDCYERRTLYELLEQICSKYLLIVHEVVYNGERCFLFTRFTETGTYKVYDIEEQEWTTLTVAGDDTEDFYDRFVLASNENNRKLIRPQKKITVISEYYRADQQEFPFGLSKYTGYTLVDGIKTYFLNPMAGQLLSDYLKTQTSQYSYNQPAVIMGGIEDGDDAKERIIIHAVPDNTKILTAVFSGMMFPGTFTVEFDEVPDNYTFKYSIQCLNYYWDDENSEWTTTEYKYDGNVGTDKKFTTTGFYYDDTYTNGRPLKLNIYTTTQSYVNSFIISDIKATGYVSHGLPDKYNENVDNEKVFTGPNGAESETELTSIFGIPSNPSYMFDIQQRIVVDVIRQDVTYEDYIKLWTFDDDPLKYRLIGVEDSMRDSIMRLVFIGCETISE